MHASALCNNEIWRDDDNDDDDNDDDDDDDDDNDEDEVKMTVVIIIHVSTRSRLSHSGNVLVHQSEDITLSNVEDAAPLSAVLEGSDTETEVD